MAVIIGLFEIAPTSGTAGENNIGHKLREANTGRNQHQKLIRATITNPEANEDAIEILKVEAKPPFLTLDTEVADVVHNAIEKNIAGVSNAEKFRISTTDTGKNLSLKANTGYTVSGLVGTFTEGFGLTAQGTVSILVGFTTNTTAAAVDIPVLVEYYDGEAWQVAGTFTITQATSDSTVSFTLDPATLTQFDKAGEERTVSIQSNVGYTIEKQGGADVSWLTLSRVIGNVGTENLILAAAAQPVGASARELIVIFKSDITGSVIGQLAISQAAGDDFSISWENEEIAFTNNQVGTIIYNKLTANADWNIEEVLS
ncbi:MAG: hypothetical protein LBR26_09435 [Prevotella sp.]|jgi:hypothetical protein|nr:hypothetical protein [Prevotella sp.]